MSALKKMVKYNAMVVKEYGKPLVLEQRTTRPPVGREVLVKMLTSGICHTDLHAAAGDWEIKAPLPRVPGHEGIGEIVDVGPLSHLKVGQVVGLPWLVTTCQHCEYCITGREQLCYKQENRGYFVDGSFQEFTIADSDYCIEVPKEMDLLTTAPIFCAGWTSYQGLKRTQVRAGEWIAIYGIGGLGHLAVQYAKAMGFRIAGVVAPNDTTAAQNALKWGCEKVYSGPGDKSASWIKEQTGGAHGALVTAVATQPLDQAFQSLRRDGTIVVVGLPADKMSFSIFQLVLNQINVRGSIVGNRKDLQECLDMTASFNIKPHVKSVKLTEVNDVFDALAKQKVEGRCVIDFR